MVCQRLVGMGSSASFLRKGKNEIVKPGRISPSSEVRLAPPSRFDFERGVLVPSSY